MTLRKLCTVLALGFDASVANAADIEIEAIEAGTLRINLAGRTVTVDGNPVELTSTDVRSAGAPGPSPGARLQPGAAARSGVGVSARRLRAHRQFTHQQAADQGRGRRTPPGLRADRLGCRLQIPRLIPELKRTTRCNRFKHDCYSSSSSASSQSRRLSSG